MRKLVHYFRAIYRTLPLGKDFGRIFKLHRAPFGARVNKPKLFKKASTESGSVPQRDKAIGDVRFNPTEGAAGIDKLAVRNRAVDKLSIIDRNCRPVKRLTLNGFHSSRFQSCDFCLSSSVSVQT